MSDDGDGEDEADEAFGEDVEGAGDGEGVAAEAEVRTHVQSGIRLAQGSCGFAVGAGEFFGAPEEVEGEGGPEADVGVGESDAGEDEDAEAGERMRAA